MTASHPTLPCHRPAQLPAKNTSSRTAGRRRRASVRPVLAEIDTEAARGSPRVRARDDYEQPSALPSPPAASTASLSARVVKYTDYAIAALSRARAGATGSGHVVRHHRRPRATRAAARASGPSTLPLFVYSPAHVAAQRVDPIRQIDIPPTLPSCSISPTTQIPRPRQEQRAQRRPGDSPTSRRWLPDGAACIVRAQAQLAVPRRWRACWPRTRGRGIRARGDRLLPCLVLPVQNGLYDDEEQLAPERACVAPSAPRRGPRLALSRKFELRRFGRSPGVCDLVAPLCWRCSAMRRSARSLAIKRRAGRPVVSGCLFLLSSSIRFCCLLFFPDRKPAIWCW